jgi:hypothetical protein
MAEFAAKEKIPVYWMPYIRYEIKGYCLKKMNE